MDGVKESLQQLLGGKENREKYLAAWLQANWQDMVGAGAAARSYPAALRDKVLFLRVDGSSWAHDLLMQKKDIVDKINLSLNDIIIKDIKLSQRRARPDDGPSTEAR
jgi:predicted nucleic acid-binding Zn ribbon protein